MVSRGGRRKKLAFSWRMETENEMFFRKRERERQRERQGSLVSFRLQRLRPKLEDTSNYANLPLVLN